MPEIPPKISSEARCWCGVAHDIRNPERFAALRALTLGGHASEETGDVMTATPDDLIEPAADAVGEQLRQVFGIDGTRGDAQDVEHPFVGGSWCWVCGLAKSYRKHKTIKESAYRAGREDEARSQAAAALDVVMSDGDPAEHNPDWKIGYDRGFVAGKRAGREDEARNALIIRGDLDITTVVAALDRVESGGDLGRAAGDLLRRLPTWMGSDGHYRPAGPHQLDQLRQDERRAGREDAARDADFWFRVAVNTATRAGVICPRCAHSMITHWPDDERKRPGCHVANAEQLRSCLCSYAPEEILLYITQAAGREHGSDGLDGYLPMRSAAGVAGCDDRACVCKCHAAKIARGEDQDTPEQPAKDQKLGDGSIPYPGDHPTFSMQPVPGRPGVVRPVLDKPIYLDPETGAFSWDQDTPGGSR